MRTTVVHHEPWKQTMCRFGRHDWDERQNPNTRELSEVCLRCDAYRDRDQAIPGAGAAGAAGANAGGFGT